MAYLPVEFNLNEFSLYLPVKAATAFHKRMKELGFTAQDSKGMMIYSRHDSRLCAMLGPDMSLNFLQDFYDHTPGGTIYAVLEKLCVQFKGTMIGTYSIPAAGKSWGVRISQGMNLSGRDDVGQRDKVQEEEVTAPSGGTFQNSPPPVPTSPAPTPQPQASQTISSANFGPNHNFGSGQVPAGQPRQLSAAEKKQQRDKLYDLYVDNQFEQWLNNNPNASTTEQLNERVRLIKDFEAQFPKEEKEEAPVVVRDFCQWLLGTSQAGSPYIQMTESDFDDMVDEYVQVELPSKGIDKYGYDDIAKHLYELMEEAGGVKNSNGGWTYEIDMPGTTTRLKIYAENENEIDFSWLHPKTPTPAPVTLVSRKSGKSIPMQVQQHATPAFNSAHTTAYSHANTAGPPSTSQVPPIPLGFTFPVQELQEAFRFASAVLYKLFTTGTGVQHLNAVLADINIYAELLTLFNEGRDAQDLYEALWSEIPQADVQARLDSYKDWYKKLCTVQTP